MSLFDDLAADVSLAVAFFENELSPLCSALACMSFSSPGRKNLKTAPIGSFKQSNPQATRTSNLSSGFIRNHMGY